MSKVVPMTENAETLPTEGDSGPVITTLEEQGWSYYFKPSILEQLLH